MKKTPAPQPMALLRAPFRTPSLTGDIPGGDALLRSVSVRYVLTDTGYLTTVSVQWGSPDRHGHDPRKSTVPDLEYRAWEPYTTRPGLSSLLQSAARRVWAISTGPLVRRSEGQDPLPGL